MRDRIIFISLYTCIKFSKIKEKKINLIPMTSYRIVAAIFVC